MTPEKTIDPKAASPGGRTATADGLILPITGLGVWNLYFLAKFGLAWAGYLNLSPLWNALFIAVLLIPLRSGILRFLRGAAGIVCAFLLLWSESWLPGIESITANAGGIAGFSWNYILELALDFINWQMVGWGALGIILYVLLRNTIRITFVTLCCFVGMTVTPMVDAFFAGDAEKDESVVAAVNGGAAAGKNQAVSDSKTVKEWYEAFLAYEKERRAEFPTGIPEKDTPFDILLLNICSLSNDDLAASQLENHPLFSRFNIRFDNFNSATSYSGPAALRLLTGACGQPSHNDLYGERRTECETLNRLGALGFSQHVMMDHTGEYDDFLQVLRDKTGLSAPLESKGQPIPIRYMGFDDEELADTLALLRFWQRTTARAKEKRSVTFMNLISLHDGNRLPRHGRSEEFKPRAQRMFDDINTFIRELERTRRRVMIVLVPEHGAAVRGDRIQAQRLRDIPTLRITEVPTMVKFVGVRGLPEQPIHVTGDTSYLALTSLIGRTIEKNFFSKSGGAVPLEELVQNLPETHRVSENGQAKILELKDVEYLRRNDDDWKPYGG
ncbi:cellulose biosynthesis protein BcsG [Sutterella seckii]|uniref:Cellulose biosynthesis protein BcsG n=1 Tax=Sutterella seckii TaxID=1944635 RepID=A0AAI9WNB8_9BURK|nr:cellulose biosynthesis protein BcsG [Sutterella seckii]KAB7651416.1 cellulose biosynthesis protein BcsG [Sutterella seckii]